MRIPQVLQDSFGFFRVPQDSPPFPRIPQDFLGPRRFSRNVLVSRRFLRSPLGSFGFFEIPLDSWGFLNCKESCGIHEIHHIIVSIFRFDQRFGARKNLPVSILRRQVLLVWMSFYFNSRKMLLFEKEECLLVSMFAKMMIRVCCCYAYIFSTCLFSFCHTKSISKRHKD